VTLAPAASAFATAASSAEKERPMWSIAVPWLGSAAFCRSSRGEPGPIDGASD